METAIELKLELMVMEAFSDGDKKVEYQASAETGGVMTACMSLIGSNAMVEGEESTIECE